jgi:hypothetical protein
MSLHTIDDPMEELRKEQRAKFGEISLPTLGIRSFTEVVSVFFQLVCYSRLGTKDYYYLVNKTDAYNDVLEPSLTANLVLLVTLVIFQFPFMNEWILLMYDVCVIGRSSMSRVGCCVWLLACHALGVVLAWLVIKYVGGGESKWSNAITWMSAEGAATDEKRNDVADVIEEIVAVTALLVGYIHLTYLNFNKYNLFGSCEHLFSDFSDVTKKLAIPMEFTLHMTLLVAGLLRCFPTAHLSPHISFYLLIMRYTTWKGCACRVGGGLIGVGLSCAFFWGYYAKITGVHEEAENRKVASVAGVNGVYQAVTQQNRVQRPNLRPLPAEKKPAPGGVHGNNGAISFHDAYRHVYSRM